MKTLSTFHLVSSDAGMFNPDINNQMRAWYAYDCSGSESRLADCRSHLTEECNTRIGVQCYNSTTADMDIIPTASSELFSDIRVRGGASNACFHS